MLNEPRRGGQSTGRRWSAKHGTPAKSMVGTTTPKGWQNDNYTPKIFRPVRLKFEELPTPKDRVHNQSAENVILEKRKNNLWVKYPTP